MGTGRRLKVAAINENLICALCSGYIIEAMSIEECWHTFCRSCITRYLQANKNKEFCPRCDVKIQTLRPDKTLQDLIYKVVPGLYQNEMRRRREFYSKMRPEEIDVEGEGRGILPHGARFFSQDDSISLSLEYYNGDDHADENDLDEKVTSNGKPKRYLQCPAAVTVRHLKKFLRMKYGIGTDYRVDIIYKGERLPEEFSLIDVAYTFEWRRTSPMRFSYQIFTRNPAKTVAPQKSLKTASTIQNNRRSNPKNQSSLEQQQRQSEYLGNFNLNPTNSGFIKNQTRSISASNESKNNKKNDPYYQDFQDDSQEKLFPSSEDSNASGLRIISEKENSEESQEFVIAEEKANSKKNAPIFDEEAEDGFAMKKIFKSKKEKKEKKKHDDVYPEKRRKSDPSGEAKKKSLKRRKSMIENFSEDFESDEKSLKSEDGKNKNEALRKVFVCKDKPERKEEEVRRKKRKKSKHHEGEAKKRKIEAEPTSPTILSFAKDQLKLKVKLAPNKPITVAPVEEVEKVEKEATKDEKEGKNEEEAKKMTDKERLLHLRAVRHKNVVNKTPKDYINAPPSLTISKVDSSEQQPVKSTLVESRPSLEIMLVNNKSNNNNKKQQPEKEGSSPTGKTDKVDNNKKSETMDNFGVLDLSEKSTRTKDHSSPTPKEISDLFERNKKSTQQSILQIAQTLVSRKLSPENHLQSFASQVEAAAMINLHLLSDSAVQILKNVQSENFPESPKRFPSPSNKPVTPPISTKSLKDCENGSSLKIPFYPLIGRDRPNPIPPIPNLHEIPRGRGRPASSLTRPMIPTIKPGQNQTVRQIPNPSVVSSRQTFNLMRPSLPVLKPPPPKSPSPKNENGDAKPKLTIPPLQSIKTKLPVPKTDEEKPANINPTVPKSINNNNNNTNNNNTNKAPIVKNGSDKALIPLKNGDDNNKNKINIKLNNSNSIRRIESMTRNIESVAAGLTARAVSNAMIESK